MTALYALRFFASIGIYLHHLNYPLGTGTICVTFFFVMSGFTSAYSISKKECTLDKSYLKHYYFNKLLKLYPLYFITFLASIPIMIDYNIPFGFRNIIVNLSLIQSYYPNGNEVFYFNGLSWFVSDIMLFYLITPFLLCSLKKIKVIKNNQILLFMTATFFLVAFCIAYTFRGKMAPYSFGWWFIYISPFFRIFDYLIGFLLGLIFVNLKDNSMKKIRISWVYTILEIGTLFLLYKSYKLPYFQEDSLRYGLYYIPICALIIFIFAFGKGILSYIASTKILIHLGKLSFYIYMIHQLMINYTNILLGNPMYNAAGMEKSNYLASVYLLVIIICVSDVINRYFTPLTSKLVKSKNSNYTN